jgi:hypothetical protein
VRQPSAVPNLIKATPCALVPPALPRCTPKRWICTSTRHEIDYVNFVISEENAGTTSPNYTPCVSQGITERLTYTQSCTRRNLPSRYANKVR